jgi:hypothetical protein
MVASVASVRRPSTRADVRAAAAALGLVALAAVVAVVLRAAGSPVRASAAPLYAHWLPHAGIGTPAAITVAAGVLWHGSTLADALPWRRLLLAGYGVAVAWTLSLALVDGWERGLAGRLTTSHEYLTEVDRVDGIAAMLRGFAGRIVDAGPESWTTHVAGHPPGALLVFVALDRVGLGGGGWAALACVLTGALVAVAVPVTVRALGDEPSARAAVPFLVLFPGAVWVGASADGLFAGLAASGIALLALGLTRAGRPAAAVLCGSAGAVLALACYLSYGLVLLAPIVVAVVVLSRRVRPLPWSLAGGTAVAAAFTLAGFWWPDGYRLVVERYHQGIASERPYAYWVWANLAALVVCAGPASVAVVRRAALIRRPVAACLLPLAATASIVAADLSGLSKAEVERIWLPFAVWMVAGIGLLPPRTRRAWLLAQCGVALVVNHFLLTTW